MGKMTRCFGIGVNFMVNKNKKDHTLLVCAIYILSMVIPRLIGIEKEMIPRESFVSEHIDNKIV